jgi:Haloacid dehalogenase-like hydrolase
MWLDRYRGLLCDLDGCLVMGGKVLPGARELVAYARERLIVVSNNSTDTPATLAAKLDRLNLPIAPERIVLAWGHRSGVPGRYCAAGARRDLWSADDRPLCEIAGLGGR